jgi:hypothetical protein
MILLSSIIQMFEADFLAQYQDAILPSQRQALAAMKTCRTSLSPLMLAQCSECDHQCFVPHSCGHRNCPHCQNHESQQWLQRQLNKQVPAEYFLLTFTLPQALRSLSWHHQRVLYSLLTRCSWETVKTFTENDKQLQGTGGAITVLHTHSRRLDYHPHVHLVMPGAAIDADQRLWRTKRGKGKKTSGYLFNHKALAKVFRAKMLDAITQEGLALPAMLPATWVVDVKSVGTGEKALIYLGRYLYRGVIQEKDIVACQNGQVTFRYQDGRAKKRRTRTVSGATFLWLFLQHVLPKGFRRARNFGFLHSNSKRLIALIQWLFRLRPPQAQPSDLPRPRLTCSCCGATMAIVKTRMPRMVPSSLPAPAG